MENKIIRKWYSVEDGSDICLAECNTLDEAITTAETINGRIEIFEFNVYEDGEQELSDAGCVWVRN